MSESWMSGATIPPFSFQLNGERYASELIETSWSDEGERGRGTASRAQAFTHPSTEMCVRLNTRRFNDYSAADWLLEFENRASRDSPIIADVLPLDAILPRDMGEEVVVHHANGSSCRIDDFLPRLTRLLPGQRIEFAPTEGRSSDGVLPFFNLQFADGGLVVAIGWSGQWRLTLARDETGLHVGAGLEHTHLFLHPNEKIRTPRILVIEWTGTDPGVGQNLLRKLLLTHYCPRAAEKPAIPPAAHMTVSVFPDTTTADEASEIKALSCASSVGMEAFWMDACWFGESDRWWSQAGSWFVRASSFPNGLRPISDAAHREGMRYILWFEPERVHSGSQIAREHPEYLLTLPDGVANAPFNLTLPSHGVGDALLNLGFPGASEYLTGIISDVIRTSGVDIYRQDFNLAPLRYWRAADEPDRQGMTEIRHIEGLYALWDALLEKHPGLVIDNCASGGRRIDLETMSRSIPLWRSDFSTDTGNPDHANGGQVIGDQCQTAGLSRWIPLHSASTRTASPYEFRSALSSGIVVYCDLCAQGALQADFAQALRELKRLRRYFLGDFYPLLPLTVLRDDWCAYQYHRADLDAGFAMFLRRHESGTAAGEVGLRGLSGDVTYDVTFRPTFVDVSQKRMSAHELGALEVRMETQPGSMVVEYTGQKS